MQRDGVSAKWEGLSERLMLKYYEYLHRVRSLLRDNHGVEVLANLEDFPVDLDPSLREYHEKIAARIEATRSTPTDSSTPDRYYIHKTRPFFVGGRIYYEVTFYRAINKVSKFDRIIAFTDIDMTDKYAAYLTLRRDSIEVLGQTMPITIVLKWEVSIRPCEFDNFARLLCIVVKTKTNWAEYRRLMHWLTASSGGLLDVVDMPDKRYATFRERVTQNAVNPRLFPMLDEVRRIVRAAAPGHNVLRYLMLRMHNQILKPQYYHDGCSSLSDMKLLYGCIPFDTMPFCTSLPGHNPRYWDLIESLDATGRTHELLARRVKNNVETHGILYTPVADLEGFGDVSALLSAYNNKLYYKHTERRLVLDKGHVFISGYEGDTVSIVETLQGHATSGIAGYTQAVERWLNETPQEIDDPLKEEALKKLFSHSCVALIYGAAGTGKSTMVDHIAHYFNDKEKLFLAHTNPAIDNLKRRVTAQNSAFRTISSHIHRGATDEEYDLLIIDECSTVSNADLIKVLERTSFKLLVLVGDVFQIESIQFGNWFKLHRGRRNIPGRRCDVRFCQVPARLPRRPHRQRRSQHQRPALPAQRLGRMPVMQGDRAARKWRIDRRSERRKPHHARNCGSRFTGLGALSSCTAPTYGYSEAAEGHVRSGCHELRRCSLCMLNPTAPFPAAESRICL